MDSMLDYDELWENIKSKMPEDTIILKKKDVEIAINNRAKSFVMKCRVGDLRNKLQGGIKMAKEKSKIRDIFNGKYIQVWQDEDFVWMSLPFPFVIINIPKEEWTDFKKDIEKLAEI